MSIVARLGHRFARFWHRTEVARPGRRRRAVLRLEELEDRTVPTLLGQQLFPADNPWNQKITSAPVAGNSGAIINNIVTHYGDGRLHPDFGQDAHAAVDLYGIPYNVVHGNSSPLTMVVLDAYPGESDRVPAPVPAGAAIEGDYQNGPKVGVNNRGDSHLVVWDQDNDVAYEFYRASRPSENPDGKWHADQETVWDMKVNTFRTVGWTSADAAGLSILAGLARPDEAAPVSQGGQGAINHALRFTLQNSVVLDQFLYPASHTANPGNTNAVVQVPMGARFRLKAGVNISGLSPQARVVAQALKDYGLIVADNGSNFYISGASDAVGAGNQRTLTWNDNDIQDTLHGLKSLHFSDFEVIDLTPVVTGLSATSGPAGTTVTVLGQNFSGAAGRLQVFFGAAPAASVTIVDDGHVTAVAPVGGGTVDVRVQSGISTAPDAGNVKSTIFGYGISAITVGDRFTYGAAGSGSPGVTPPGGSGNPPPPGGSTPPGGTTPPGSGSPSPPGGASGGGAPTGLNSVPITSTVGIVDPSGRWYLHNSNTGGSPDIAPFVYGAGAWVPVAGDWDGDGQTTAGVFNPASATWYLRNSNSSGAPAQQFAYGGANWLPVAGDWDGDGKTTVGVFDPATATWYLKNSNGPGAPDITPFRYGAPGWIPIAGDWNGDGKASVGVVDPNTGIWYLKNSNGAGGPDIAPFRYGAPGWRPVVGAWNGQGRTTVGVFDPDTATWYLKNSNGPGAPDVTPFRYGGAGWRPVVGDWNFPGLPELAADGQGAASGLTPLGAADLAGVRDAALARLAGAGIDAKMLATLASVRFEVGALPPGYLGLAFPDASRVVLDGDAAGHGWFIDPTPLQDEEFAPGGTALAGGPASRRMDLLTVALHELGHVAGLDDDAGSGLMGEALGAGVRQVSDLQTVFGAGKGGV